MALVQVEKKDLVNIRESVGSALKELESNSQCPALNVVETLQVIRSDLTKMLIHCQVGSLQGKPTEVTKDEILSEFLIEKGIK